MSKFNIEIFTEDVLDGMAKQVALQTILSNLTTPALEVIARLSETPNCSKKVVEKESFIKKFL